MKTNEDYVEEYKHLMVSEVLTVWDEKTGDEVFVPDWLRTTLEEVRREERERIVAQVRNIIRQGKVDVFNSRESNVEWLLQALTPTKTDHLPDRPLNVERD